VTVPVGKGKPTRAPVDALDLIYSWDDDGIQLVNLEGQRSRMQPGTAPAKIDRATAASPDGKYTVAFGDASLDVTARANNETRTFKPTFRSDIRAIARASENAPEWLGPHSLILRGSPDLVLDLETLKVRPLAKVGVNVLCTSPNGAHALIEDDGGLVQSE